MLELLNAAVQRLVVEAQAQARGGVNLAAPGRAVHRDAGAPGDAVERAALSPREGEVLRCIAAGDSNEMIARALNLGPHTVKRHVANIPDKLGSRDAVRQLDSRSPSFVGDGLQALRRRRDGAAAD